MIIPPFLKQGDTVGIICTARKFTVEETTPAVELLKSWGLSVKLGKTIGLDNHQLGGSDDERASDFQAMINDPEIKAIWCARGGYGTVRMIDKIDFKPLLKNPKWVIGFSDVTVLHSHIHQLGLATIHAIMPFSVTRTQLSSILALKETLFGHKVEYQIPASIENKSGNATGILVGGNLSIIYSLLGSTSSIETKDKILFIEDLDEYLYHVDRMLMNLKRNGYFSQLKGLIVGGMTDMHDNEIPYGMNEKQIILDIVKEYDFPVVFDFPAGHIQDNRALLLGKEVSLQADKNQVIFNYIK
jgi:muramoyltetrapeptide carboxypeptidase